MLQRNICPQEGAMFLLIELISSLIARFSRDGGTVAPSRVTHPYV